MPIPDDGLRGNSSSNTGFVDSIRQGVEDFGSEALSNGTVKNVAGAASDVVNAIRDPSKFMSNIRSKNIPSGAELPWKTSTPATIVSNDLNRDWRVRLSVPNLPEFNSELLAPLSLTGNSMVFPYTPTIIMSHSANYNATNPTHTNYTYFNFVNSQVDQIMITGDFTVENSKEGRYWIAMVHYLRSVSKMFYGGDSANSGSPPPVVRLNGYGDYVYKNVPVVVQNFTVDLPSDVDYIATPIGGSRQSQSAPDDGLRGSRTQDSNNNGDATSWVPTRCTVSVTVVPVYSRQTVEQFSLKDFVNGTYVKNGQGFI